MPALLEGRPTLLLGGLVPSAYARAARHGQGWVAPLFGLSVLEEGAAAVRRAWAQAKRSGQPRIATGRYFCLGDDADAVADEYIRHYYGAEFFAAARADTLTTGKQLRTELEALQGAGATDLVLFPSSGRLEQVGRLAEALHDAGFLPARSDGSEIDSTRGSVTIARAVPNIRSNRPAETRDFFVRLLGFEVAMDLGWVVTVVSPTNPSAQVTIVGNEDMAAPGISVEVPDVDAVHANALGQGLEIAYPLRDEEWGVRRFMLREPSGTIVNVLSHRSRW
jgi:catechol 2,3-dioxygenase-like lactoylglutathione lyase family enzyme